MAENGEILAAAKAAVAADDVATAIKLLRRAVLPMDGFITQSRAARVLAPQLSRMEGLRPLKIAILANSTADNFLEILRLWLVLGGIRPEFYLAPFGMMSQSVLDPNSELYSFAPDVVWMFSTYRDVRLEFEAGVEPAVVDASIEKAVRETADLWAPLFSRLNCLVVQNNADIPAEDSFGNVAGGVHWGRRHALHRYNTGLASAVQSGVVIFDFDHLSAMFGKARWVDQRFWHHSKHPFNFDAIGLVAHAGAQLLAASRGLAKKCLVLDLDNTLWGGVIGDDGLDGIHLGTKADGEAFVAFQTYIKELKNRGVILAVCSKNDEANAKEPFLRHPDMQLTLQDIAVFRANWENKADNIREIAAILNVGLDALVFVDDNPVERALVRRFLPMVEAVELPEDPSGYSSALDAGRYFETLSFSAEDKERSRYYQENAQRAELRVSFKDAAQYLASLEMLAETGSADSFHLPRMSQLINKSNQFHLTGTRYSVSDLEGFAKCPDVTLRYFKLRDRYGDNGLISVVVLRQEAATLMIDTWVMSCRVLARSMEEFILAEIVKIAREKGCQFIGGRYVPSAKNKLVSDLFKRLQFGFVSEHDGVTLWRRDAKGELPVTQVRHGDLVLEN